MIFCPNCKSLVLSPAVLSEYPNNSVEWLHTFRCDFCGHRFKTVERYEREQDYYNVYDID